MAPARCFLLGLAVLCAAVTVQGYPSSNDDDRSGPDPPYDHQTTPYEAQFKPVRTTVSEGTVQAFFSPDHSIDTITGVVDSVPAGGVLSIGSPGLSSWSGCTRFDNGCVGCTVQQQHDEEFPVFPAILNALQRGATVRLLINNYDTPTCPGKIAPLDYLSLAGVDIRHYRTTTFMHAKYMTAGPASDAPMPDGIKGPAPASQGRITSISSVNWSFTSFMLNREAGMVLKDGTEALQDLWYSTWEHDFAEGLPFVVNQTYSAADMAIITSKTQYPVVMPTPKNLPGAYVTPKPTDIAVKGVDATAYVSPDWSLDEAMADVQGATTSFELMIYQVTDPGLCSELFLAHRRGVNVTLLVSKEVFDARERHQAETCYANLTKAGMAVQSTMSAFTYSHQKFWITDGRRVSLSSGNWSPSDVPDATAFPPYPDPAWVAANRDVNIHIEAPQLVTLFQTVLNEDYTRGEPWGPNSMDDSPLYGEDRFDFFHE